MSQRKIIHVDMDCFYAAVEMRDNPQLRKQPIAVGGNSQRGVISTCNYLARKYGVRSAMPVSMARRHCPDLIVVPHHFEKYRQASHQVREILSEYTQAIEPLSLDEAYLDVSESTRFNGSASLIALDIRRRIARDLGISASAGISVNKFIAKIASDWNKPNGQFCVPPEAIDRFLCHLPVGKIYGVGKVMTKQLNDRGIYNCQDLKQFSEQELSEYFGNFGHTLYQLARGIDDRPVKNNRERKSISTENTFDEDLNTLESCQEALGLLLLDLKKRFEKHKSRAKIIKIFVKIKFSDFSSTSIERRAELLHPQAFLSLLTEAYTRSEHAVRLLGVGLKLQAEQQDEQQLELPLENAANIDYF